MGFNTLIIRALAETDILKFVEHISRTHVTSGRNGVPFFQIVSASTPFKPTRHVEKIQTRLKTPVEELGWGRYWGVFDGDTMVGNLGLLGNTHSLTMAHRCTLVIGLEAAYTAKGLGKKLMNEALDWARAQPNLHWVDLGVFAENYAARKLYKSLGFIEIGRRNDFARIDGHSIDDIEMALEVYK